MIIKKCIECKKSFSSFPSRNRRYCSRRCSNINSPALFTLGHKHTQGKKHGKWNGGKAKHSSGYIYIKQEKHPYKDVRGYVLEHRLVVEKHIGRFLSPKEVVHHINGNKIDNRIENLKLFSNQSHHIKEEYVTNQNFKEQLKKYQFKRKLI